MRLNRRQYVIYAVVLCEHPEIVKLGRTTNWRSRRREYDNWNFAQGDGVLECIVFHVTDEYVDLPALEAACLDGMSTIRALHRGNEWFKGTLADAERVITDVLCAGDISFLDSRPPAQAPRLVVARK